MNIKKEIERLYELEKIVNDYEGCNIDVNVEIDVEKIDEIIKHHTINLLKALEIKGEDISSFKFNTDVLKKNINIFVWTNGNVTIDNKSKEIFKIEKED